MTEKRARLSLSTVRQRLQSMGPATAASAVAEVSATRSAFRQAASVLSFFDPATLKPVSAVANPEQERAAFVDEDCTPVYDAQDRIHFRIKDTLRKDALRSLGTRTRLRAALDANPDRPQDALQCMLERHIGGEGVPLEQQSLNQLSASEQVVRWLEDTLRGLPRLRDVRRRMAIETVLQPLRQLVGDHFRGRSKELRKLEKHVSPGAAPESSAPPLFLYGPGGVGKSTLVAKFVLEQARVDDPEIKFPFVYINFDRPEFAAEEPITLLLECVRQIGAEYDVAKAAAENLSREWVDRLLAFEVPGVGDYVDSLGGRIPGSLIHERKEFYEAFSDFIKGAGLADRPLLLVLDTFESVQYHGLHVVDEVRTFLEELQALLPSIRTVIAGRAPAKDISTDELELKEFDNDAAQAFLSWRLEAAGVNAPDIAETVVRQVGGNPLTLLLAAEVIRLEMKEGAVDERGIRDLDAGFLLWRVKEAKIQGLLYKRILEHLECEHVETCEDLRKLAYPGLTLRRLTPDIIRRVLAKPCGVRVRSDRRAQILFDELARQVFLVTVDDDGSLRHRADVRTVMIQLLMENETKRAIRLHRGAKAYYEKRKGAVARAEEIYHRLWLGQRPATIDKRWVRGVERYLAQALEEFPEPQRVYLASRLDVPVSEETVHAAALKDWERLTARRVRQLLRLNKPAAAAELLAERRGRSAGSPLFSLEAQAYMAAGRPKDAVRVTRRGIKDAERRGAAKELVTLRTVHARAAEGLGRYAQAYRALLEARRFAASDDCLRLLKIDVALLRLRRRVRRRQKISRETLTSEVTRCFRELPRSRLVTAPMLLRALAGEVGEQEQELLKSVLEMVGIGPLDDEAAEQIATALSQWDRAKSRKLSSHIGLRVRHELPRAWLAWLKQTSSRGVGSTLGIFLERYGPRQSVVRVICKVLRESGVRPQQVPTTRRRSLKKRKMKKAGSR